MPVEADRPAVNLLDLVPVPTASSKLDGERVILIRPRPRPGRRWLAPVHWLIFQMAARELRLDDVGSFCWQNIDGKCTAGDIAERLRDRFGESVEPAEERIGKFFLSLQREELLSFEE